MSSLLSSSIASAGYLVALQFSSRLVTFVLNQALLRTTTPQAFGVATIQLEFLLNTILFFSREGFRGAILRGGSDGDRVEMDEREEDENGKESLERRRQAQLLFNTSLIPIALGIPLSIIASLLFHYSSTRETRSEPGFTPCVTMYGLAAIVELLSEPLFLLAQREMKTRLRVMIEGTAVILKGVTTIAAMVSGGEGAGLRAFALGQLVYAATLVVVYTAHYASVSGHKSPIFSPRPVVEDLHGNTRKIYFDSRTTALAGALTQQSVVKQFLTEGDKLIVGRMSHVQDQGGYAVALNYGSLVARILFQPIEESARLFFSKSLGSTDVRSDPSPPSDGVPPTTLSPDATVTDANRDISLRLLSSLILLHVHLGLFFISFGPAYVSPILHVLLGRRWSTLTSASSVLRAYCYYVPFLGLNGITEAFVQAVATRDQITSMGRWFVLFSAVYIAGCFVFVRLMDLKEEGLVWANVLNMTCRIVYSVNFILQFFPPSSSSRKAKTADGTSSSPSSPSATSLIKAASPTLPTLAVFGVCALACRLSLRTIGWTTLPGLLKHLVVGGVGAMICLVVCGLGKPGSAARTLRSAMRN